MSDQFSSIDIDLLATFIESSATETTAVQGDVEQVQTQEQNLVAISDGDIRHDLGDNNFTTQNKYAGNGLAMMAAVMDVWKENRLAAKLIHDDVSGDKSVDPANIPNGRIEGVLDENGLLEAPEVVPIEIGEIIGAEPYSGFSDDPVCTFNGNFVYYDTDIETPGFAQVINLKRTYNSLMSQRRGMFGFGWTSLLDMRVADDADVVRVTLSDGAVIPFVQDENGEYVPNRRRMIQVNKTVDGWVVRQGAERIWLFDLDGKIVGGGFNEASFVVRYDDKTVVVVEQLSQRSITLSLSDVGFVESATTSDGRSVRYDYAEGQCVRAVRAIGDVIYTVADGLITEVHDGDGVLMCRNTYEDGRVASQQSPHGTTSEYEYLDNHTTRLTYPDQDIKNLYIHDERGRMTAMFGGDGSAQRITFDEYDRVVRIVDRDGAATHFTYDDSFHGQWVEKRYADGLCELREFDEEGRLVRAINRSGHVTSHSYEGSNRAPTTTVIPSGGVISNVFDENKLPVKTTDADGYTNTVIRNSDGLVETLINASGQSVSYTYDAAGKMLAETDSLGRSTTFERDEAGRISLKTAMDGSTGRYEYTSAGRMLASVSDSSGSWSATYGDHGKVETFSDALAATTRISYDSMGRPVQVTGPDGSTYLNRFDSLSQLTSTVDPLGNETTQTFDAAGRVLSVIDKHGSRWGYSYDSLGQLTSRVHPNGSVSNFTYHPDGQISSLSADDLSTTFELNDFGQPVATVDPLGGRTTYEYSLAGRPVSTISAAGRRLDFVYDEAGSLTSVMDADGEDVRSNQPRDTTSSNVSEPFSTIAEFKFVQSLLEQSTDYDGVVDAQVELRSVLDVESLSAFQAPEAWSGPVEKLPTQWDIKDRVHADVISRAASFDSRGLLSSVTDPTGLITKFGTDMSGRLVEVTTGVSSQSIAYGSLGNVVAVTNALGQRTTAERDTTGRIRSVTFADGDTVEYDLAPNGLLSEVRSEGAPLVSFIHDPSGLLTGATTPAGTVSATFDEFGLLSSATSLDGSVTTYERDADGMLSKCVYADGSSVTYVRSPAGRILELDHSVAGRVTYPSVTSNGVNHDDSERIVVDDAGRTFRYDPAGRLAESVTADGNRSEFRYNDYGLLASETTPRNGARQFFYNIAGQLTAITSDTNEVRFTYDAAGRRTRADHSDGRRTTYVWNGLNQLVEVHVTDADGGLRSRQITYSGFGRPELVDNVAISWDDALSHKPVRVGETSYLRSGLLVRPAVPEAEWSDGVVDDPWGDDGLEGVRLGFRNELTVDGLVFMGDRVYDPTTRSFLTIDPIPSTPGANAFVGVYSYAWNDPINFVDPTGRSAIATEDFDKIREGRERSRFGRVVHGAKDWAIELAKDHWIPIAIITAPFWLPKALAVGVIGYTGFKVLDTIGDLTEGTPLAGPWNDLYGDTILPGIVDGLFWTADKFVPDPTADQRGDAGGTYTTEQRPPFLAEGDNPVDRGRGAIIEGLEHTADGTQIKPDEFEIVDHGNGSYTIVLPGVTDLSNPVAGFDEHDQTVRDLDQGASRSVQSANVDDNLYAQYVQEAMERAGVPKDANIMLVGHSYGADTALDLASDDQFNRDYNVTHVYAAAYDSEPQLPYVDEDIEVFVAQNDHDAAVKVEHVGHSPAADGPEGQPDTTIVDKFDYGGTEGAGHHQNNYVEGVENATSPEQEAFFASVDEGGYTQPGDAEAVDISYDPTKPDG